MPRTLAIEIRAAIVASIAFVLIIVAGLQYLPGGSGAV